ncbi:MAG: universal stress protein [Desulfitobacterium sp.]|nr:universal stress protein [Desulfitobacterium sp.]
MFKRILVPTDASEYSIRALKKAIELAKLTGAELYLMHVAYSPQALMGYTLNYGITTTHEDMLNFGRAALDATLGAVDAGDVTVNTIVEVGHPAGKILEQIEKDSIDCVVIGSHGYGPITGSVLGSVSQRIVQKAPCPVLLVK